MQMIMARISASLEFMHECLQAINHVFYSIQIIKMIALHAVSTGVRAEFVKIHDNQDLIEIACQPVLS